MSDIICTIMGAIDILAVIVLFCVDVWMPLKILLIIKLLYSGFMSFT